MFDNNKYKCLTFCRPNGIPTGHSLANPDWPWELMYDDLMWAIQTLQNSPNDREARMAFAIANAWFGEIKNVRVHQLNAPNQPIEA